MFQVAVATATAAGSGLMEEVLGPSDEVVTALATEASVGNVDTRAEAIWKLAQYDHESCVEPLLALVPGAPPEARPYLAMGLGWLGPKARKAAPALAAYLDKEPPPFLASATLWALGRLGDPAMAPRIAPFTTSENEMLRFLAEEARQALAGKEQLPATPLRRPLKGATILWVGIIHNGKGGPDTIAQRFSEALSGMDVRFEVVALRAFNPAMSYLGGMPPQQEERFSQLLAFKDGAPQVDVVMLPYLFPYELPLRSRWELWNYVRRGGKLVISTDLFKQLSINSPNTGGGTTKKESRWRRTLFDSALPTGVERAELPFLDGVAPASAKLPFGVCPLRRGLTLMLNPAGVPITRDAVIATTHSGYFEAAFYGVFGQEKVTDPVLWQQTFKWLLEGPEAFVVTASVTAAPVFKAGETAEVNLRVRNYQAAAPELNVAVTLKTPDGAILSSGRQELAVPRDARRDVQLALAIPLATCTGACQLLVTVTDKAGHACSEAVLSTTIAPAFRLVLQAPGELGRPGTPLALLAKVEKTRGRSLPQASIIGAIADVNLRPLFRQVRTVDLAETGRGDYAFELTPGELPPGMYFWTLEVQYEGHLLHRETAPLVRPAPFDLRQELVVAEWGFGAVAKGRKLAALKAMGMTSFNLPVTDGMWTWSVYSPSFYPTGLWPADSLAGELGTEWREFGQSLKNQPLYTVADTTEESELEVGTNVFQKGDVEKEGHEQYRIFLKQKYRTLAALNAAWSADFADWSEIRLLGALALNKDDVTYTGRIVNGDLVRVPEKVDPASGLVSRQPYLDQNAWHWHCIFEQLAIRQFAFHQTDPYHPLQPGGAMGLIAPFDIPHFRIYPENSLLAFSRRTTLSRETYGLKPHTVLIGVGRTEAENSKLLWSGLAAGGRLFTTYSDGSGLGQYILNPDSSLSAPGAGLARVLADILPWQEAFLACRNAVDRNALFLSSGNPWDDDLTVELYDALHQSGTLMDYGRDLAGRKLLFCRSGSTYADNAAALKQFVNQGGTLVLLLGAPAELLHAFGITVSPAALPKGFVAKVEFRGQAPLAGVTGALASTARTQLQTAGADWQTPARYADADLPAILQRTIGKGQVWFLNLEYVYDATLDMKGEATSINEANQALRDQVGSLLQRRYAADGRIRREAELYRRTIAAIAASAGVTGSHQVLDRDGSVLPYVIADLCETPDRSQRYLIAYADHRLPPGVAAATGEIHLKLPGVCAVRDVCNQRDVPLKDGRFAFEFAPGRGALFSLLTEAPGNPELTPARAAFAPGAALEVGVRVPGADGKLATAEHAFNLQVFDKDGKEITGLRQHRSLRGQGVVTLFPAWTDPDGAWRVVAHDLTTGRKGEASVRKDNALPAPAPAAALDAYRPPPPELQLTCAPLELPAFANFVPLKATLTAAGGKSVKLRVTLQIPEACRLSGEREQTFTLTAAASQSLNWDLFVSRDEAIALYYSAKPAGFLVGLQPQVRHYQGQPMPTLKLEVLEGGPVTFAAAGAPAEPTGAVFSYTVPVHVMPFLTRPPLIGALASQELVLSVRNGLDRPLNGSIQLSGGPQDVCAGLAPVDFKLAPGTSQDLRFVPTCQPGAPVMPGLADVPVRVRIGDRSFAGGHALVEIGEQRAWRFTTSTFQQAQAESFPFTTTGELREPQKWLARTGSAAIPFGVDVPRVDAVAYAYTRIHAAADYDVQFRTALVGAAMRIWLNGDLAFDSVPSAGPAKDATAEFLKATPELKRGWNSCIVELHRTARRYLDPPLVLLSKDGKVLRELRFDARAGAEH